MSSGLRPAGRLRLLLPPALWAVALVGCATVLGEYEVDSSSNAQGGSGTLPPQPECTNNEQCQPPTDRCNDGYCRQPCLNKSDCQYYFSVCSGGYCSEHVGTPCVIDEECGGLDCEAIDSRDQPVAGYCTMSCSNTWECPLDFECIHSDCLQIGTGGPLCYVYKDAPCSTCAVLECDWELQACCGYSSPCAAVQASIDACDATRTWDDCNPLYNENDIDDPAYELLDCLTRYCESSCWNPCPGDAC